jgi:hypothetical protein
MHVEGNEKEKKREKRKLKVEYTFYNFYGCILEKNSTVMGIYVF